MTKEVEMCQRLERVVEAEIEEQSESLLRWWEGSTARHGLRFRPADRTRGAQFRSRRKALLAVRRQKIALKLFREVFPVDPLPWKESN